jgi:AraC-like DNA-binding protein
MEPAFPFLFDTGADPPPQLFTLILVERGVLQIQWGETTKMLAVGSLLLVPPSTGARIACRTDTVLMSCSFARSLVDPLALNGSVESIVGMLAGSAPLATRLRSQGFADMRAVFTLLGNEAGARRAGYEAMVRLKLMEALLNFSRGLDASSAIAPNAPLRHRPEDAMRYIQEHFADPLSSAQIAEAFGHNPSYFSRLFHQHAGMTIVEYINRIRIQKSCQLLKRSEAGITEIALAVGYNNISHFNRFFRRIMDMSPREYRLQSRK